MILRVLPRVYPILDTAVLLSRGADPLTFAEGVFEGGARILQFRHKTPFDRESVAILERIAAMAREAGATLIVNDRADLAAVFDCGLHLGQSDLPPALARKVLPAPHPIGISTHNATQLAAAVSEPVDYIALGPIFATSSKGNPDPVIGVGRLADWRMLSTLPLVAVGGITRENAQQVWLAGADSIAAIGDFIPETISRASVCERMEQWLKLSSQTL